MLKNLTQEQVDEKIEKMFVTHPHLAKFIVYFALFTVCPIRMIRVIINVTKKSWKLGCAMGEADYSIKEFKQVYDEWYPTLWANEIDKQF